MYTDRHDCRGFWFGAQAGREAEATVRRATLFETPSKTITYMFYRTPSLRNSDKIVSASDVHGSGRGVQNSFVKRGPWAYQRITIDQTSCCNVRANVRTARLAMLRTFRLKNIDTANVQWTVARFKTIARCPSMCCCLATHVQASYLGPAARVNS